MTRAELRTRADLSDWISIGVSKGYWELIVSALDQEIGDSNLPVTLPHVANIELGRIQCLRQVKHFFRDPLGLQDEVRTAPRPNYGVTDRTIGGAEEG